MNGRDVNYATIWGNSRWMQRPSGSNELSGNQGAHRRPVSVTGVWRGRNQVGMIVWGRQARSLGMVEAEVGRK